MSASTQEEEEELEPHVVIENGIRKWVDGDEVALIVSVTHQLYWHQDKLAWVAFSPEAVLHFLGEKELTQEEIESKFPEDVWYLLECKGCVVEWVRRGTLVWYDVAGDSQEILCQEPEWGSFHA